MRTFNTLPILNQLAMLDRKAQVKWLRRLTHLVVWIPLLILFSEFWFYSLGPEPIREIILRTGKWGLIFLIASLAITPINTIFGWKQLIPVRKLLGLYAFMYICLHLLTFIGLDYQFAWGLIIEEIIQRRYALVGFAAFLILLPLAATSTKWAMRKLGKNWKRLHRWAYVAAALGVLHFIMSVKNTYNEPGTYGLILLFLLIVRITPIRKRLAQLRRQRRGSG